MWLESLLSELPLAELPLKEAEEDEAERERLLELPADERLLLAELLLLAQLLLLAELLLLEGLLESDEDDESLEVESLELELPSQHRQPIVR